MLLRELLMKKAKRKQYDLLPPPFLGVLWLRGSVNRRVAYVSRHDGKAIESL
jgi:hypothetical protein